MGDLAALSAAMSPPPDATAVSRSAPTAASAPAAASSSGVTTAGATEDYAPITPPQGTRGRRARSGAAADDPLSPMANCGTEELRVFVQRNFLIIENVLQQVQNTQMRQQQVIDSKLPAEFLNLRKAIGDKSGASDVFR